MKIRKIYFLVLLLLGVLLGACKDEQTEFDKSGYTDALVTSFQLTRNDSVASNLQNLFFTIDHYGELDGEGNLVGQIYNADSLPVGTATDKLLAEIGFSGPSKVTLYTVSDTLEYSSTDSLNFTEPVRMEVIAGDEKTTKYYMIKVNVHQQYGDSIHWHLYVENPLNDVVNPTAERAVAFGSAIFWYVAGSEGVSLYTSGVADLQRWSKQAITIPTGVNVELQTLREMSGKLYMVSTEGALLVSGDGYTWSVASTQYSYKNLIGSLQGVEAAADRLVAIVEQEGAHYFANSTDGLTWTLSGLLDTRFPVTGYSDAVQYFAGTLQRMVIVGGRMSNGTLSSSTWAWDGVNAWQEITQRNLLPTEGAALISYEHDSRYSGTFWMLISGANIYYSPNKGITWILTTKRFVFPLDYENRSFSSVYVGSDYFINLFGGKDEVAVKNQIWRGRLNSLTFRPVE